MVACCFSGLCFDCYWFYVGTLVLAFVLEFATSDGFCGVFVVVY